MTSSSHKQQEDSPPKHNSMGYILALLALLALIQTAFMIL